MTPKIKQELDTFATQIIARHDALKSAKGRWKRSASDFKTQKKKSTRGDK